LDVANLALSYIIGMAISTLIFVPQFRKIFNGLKNYPVEKITLMYHVFKGHGKWQIGLNLFSSLKGTVKFWIVKLLISTEGVGYLALAQNLYSVLASLIPLSTVTLPIIARRLNDSVLLEKILQKTTKYSLLIYTIIITGALVVISPLIPFVFPKYIVALPLFNLLVFKLLFNAFTASQPAVLYAKHDQRFLFYSTVISITSVIGLSFLLIPIFGLIGAIVEALITILIVDVIREIYLRKRYNIKTISIKSLFSIDETDKRVVSGLLKGIRKKIRI